jgi:hypothetical protein
MRFGTWSVTALGLSALTLPGHTAVCSLHATANKQPHTPDIIPNTDEQPVATPLRLV